MPNTDSTVTEGTAARREQIGISPDAATLARIDRLCAALASRLPGSKPLARASVALAALHGGLDALERNLPAVRALRADVAPLGSPYKEEQETAPAKPRKIVRRPADR